MNVWKFLSKEGVKMRFAVSLVGNFLRLFLNFLTTLYLARSMGPALFGDFYFLMNSFHGLRALLDLGMQVAFFTFISAQKREKRFYAHYLFWLALQWLFMLCFITFLCPPSLLETLWLGMDRKLILLAFLASFAMNQVWEVSTNIGESIRGTFGIQLRNLILSCLYLLLLVVLHKSGQLYLPQVYLGICAIYTFMSTLHILSLRGRFLADQEFHFSYVKLSKEYIKYCLPLAVGYIASSTQGFVENWMLQRFGGSIHQGFFMLGSRFSTICLLATTAISKIFWKEIAEYFAKGNQEQIQKLLRSTFRLLYSSSAVLSGFLVPFVPLLLVHFVGPEFESAWLVMSILFVYPVHQGLGQIIAAYFQATHKTKLYRNLCLCSMSISIIITYLVLAPSNAPIPGLNGGSTGMALKMYLVTIFSVNLGFFFVHKDSGESLSPAYQIMVLGFFLSTGFLAHSIVAGLFLNAETQFLEFFGWFLCSGVLYTLTVALFGWWQPDVFGINPDMKRRILQKLSRN